MTGSEYLTGSVSWPPREIAQRLRANLVTRITDVAIGACEEALARHGLMPDAVKTISADIRRLMNEVDQVPDGEVSVAAGSEGTP